MKSLTNEDIISTSTLFNISPAALKAVIEVESSGSGFYTDAGRWKDEIKVRFEGHIFRKYTKGIYDQKYPHLSYSSWKSGAKFARVGQNEFTRFLEAVNLDKKAAWLSSSYGLFQTMGFSYSECGFDSAQEMILEYYEGEYKQLLGFIEYCKSRKILNALREKDWVSFIRKYNGNGQIPVYEQKLINAYNKWLPKMETL